MELIFGRNLSGLNPDAVPFVPLAYRAVEDYSPEWWQLVSSCPWFREYWLRECFRENEVEDNYFNDAYDQLDEFYNHVVLPDLDSVFHAYSPSRTGGRRQKEREQTTVDEMGSEKWHVGRRELAEDMQKFYYEKAQKMVINPRKIHQPR